jgi:hypothetical protein
VSMDKALVLLTIEPGMGTEVLERLTKIDGVVEAHYIIIENIRQVEGINTTMTCFVAD